MDLIAIGLLILSVFGLLTIAVGLPKQLRTISEQLDTIIRLLQERR